jgi:AAA+ ATPase superfamily predicted ATPase
VVKKYFPQGVAMGDAFCNRIEERSALKKAILSNEHTVLVAPRRYGKTSLITQVLKDVAVPSVNMDFFFVLTQAEASKQITEGVSKLINDLLPKSKLACSKLLEAVRLFNPKLTLSFLGQKLEIDTKQATERSISELLLALDYFAGKVSKPCVVVLDEFQQIGELKENHAIEAAIRHAVERSQYISYIFLGSKRHLLNEMFSDKSRPLYHLCDLMPLTRISAEDYQLFLNKQAKKRWRVSLDEDVITEILFLTERHPYYLNALCRQLWHEEMPPSLSLVRRAWEQYVKRQSAWIMNDFSALTLNRRKVLMALAHQPTAEPQGMAFTDRVKVTSAGIGRVLDYLLKRDYVYKDSQNYYRIFDPAVAYFLRDNNGVRS